MLEILLLAAPRDGETPRPRRRAGLGFVPEQGAGDTPGERQGTHASATGAEASRDAELLRRVQGDDEGALRTLVGVYAERLRDIAYLTVRDADVAADIAQDVFIWLWGHRHRVTLRGTLANYLYTATRHKALNAVKHERAQTRMRERLGEQYVVNPNAVVIPSAEGDLEARELAIAIDEAIRSLTPRVREIFLLARVQRMAYEEIADLLGVSVVTVKSQLSRALAQIWERLEGR